MLKNYTVKFPNVLSQKGKKIGYKYWTNHRNCGVTDVELPVTVYKYYAFFIFNWMLQSTVPNK